MGHASGYLGLQFVHAVVEGDLLEGGRGLGEEDERERVVGPIGQRDFHGNHAEFFCGFESGAINVGGGIVFHPLGEITEAETRDAGAGVEREGAGNAGEFAGIGPGNGMQDEHGVFDAAGHGAKLVE